MSREPACALLPYYLCRIPAGFPSPAGDYTEGPIDLIESLIHRPAATFVMRASGHSMIGAGILDGSYLIVDKSIQATPGHIVIAEINGEFTIKRLKRSGGQFYLAAENPAYPNISLSADIPLTLWGVVTATITRHV